MHCSNDPAGSAEGQFGTQPALEAGVRDPGGAAERSMRWVGWQPTETNRVERARTRHGVLNLVPRTRRALAEMMGALQECARLLAPQSSVHGLATVQSQLRFYRASILRRRSSHRPRAACRAR
jgi:hypothetical protein